MISSFQEGLSRYFSAIQLRRLANAQVGIAGAGGLGSNIAMLLARCGIGHFRIIDHDIVDASNLNRQHYWPRQLGQKKVEALEEHLKELNPNVKTDLHHIKLEPGNLQDLIHNVPFWVEALDAADIKKLFVENAAASGAKVVAASGLAGIGGLPLQKKVLGNIAIIGDFQTGIDLAPPFAPRVMQAAAMMADCMLEWILDEA